MSKKLVMALLSMLLVFTLILSGCTQTAPPSPTPAPAETPSEEPAPAEEPGEEEPAVSEENLNQLIVGSSTEPSGDFATPYWQNNATDNLINGLLSGYGTYEVSTRGEFVLNPTAVANQEVEENEDGSKTYTFTINEGLTYNDGTPITAHDYVAQALLWSSKQVRDFDGRPTAGLRLVGYDDFTNGRTKEFAGVRLLDDMTVSFTIADEYVPFFYEVTDVAFGPTPLEFWVGEGVGVADDGEGAYFTGDFADIVKPGAEDDEEAEEFAKFFEYKEHMLAQRNVTPRVTSGPYEAVSFDTATKTTIITINDKFIGNHEGQLPSIQDLVFKRTEPATQFDELRTGTVDLLSAMGGGAEINAGLDLIDEDPDHFDFISYPRAGYGKLLFIGDFGPTQFVEVRQGIAHLIDRNDFANAFTGGFGSVVHGPYGEGQWFYKDSRAELDAQLNSYDYSLETAIELFEQAGFTKNEDGSDYAGTGLRYREMEDGTMLPLLINWFSTENNPVSELLVTKLQHNPDVTAAGMVIEQTQGDFTVLLNWMYRDTSEGEEYGVPTYHMMNLASNFPLGYAVTNEHTTDPQLVEEGYNVTRILDDDLYEFSRTYSLVDPTDTEGFRTKWVDYIVRWNELLPELPLYSNEYHSFFNSKLTNFVVDDNLGLGIALLYATLE